ncbi:modification methylase [Campylobacter sp. FMV-PI01]|uniref:site-specific DNA-methyltransferase (adenine-specific) n=1 Tax=Campylobacter portucalensis TaxID=2608384 RepID=A0A6L5WJ81_9BACT|nr:DNA adenine methylase [Campylobacter portucalensis]MSN95893.1 modification methylase [Campylobacter portucalensis]
MNYIGSKLTLSSWIKDIIKDVCGSNLKDKIFCDIFAGTGIIGRAFKSEVKKVIANDFEYYAYVLNKNYIGNHKILKKSNEIIKYLDNLPLKGGFIYENYALGGGSSRQYFSDINAMKIDTIRTEIKNLKPKISENMYYFLLASLLESADKVANTASVYGAFLKRLKASAKKELILEPANFKINSNSHQVYNEDANELIKKIKGDILYLDPPYNSRQYGANYHLLNTIALYDEFIPKGKTGLREYKKSKYCSKSNVLDEFENLIKFTNFKYIFLSYNNEGLMSLNEIKNIMSKFGKYDLKYKEYSRFKADSKRQNKASKTYEYLHILEKDL